MRNNEPFGRLFNFGTKRRAARNRIRQPTTMSKRLSGLETPMYVACSRFRDEVVPERLKSGNSATAMKEHSSLR